MLFKFRVTIFPNLKSTFGPRSRRAVLELFRCVRFSVLFLSGFQWAAVSHPVSRRENQKQELKLKQNRMESMKTELISRRTVFKRALGATPAVALVASLVNAKAAPTGTRPTVLSNVAVTAVNTNTMQVSGRLTTLDGVGLAGMEVDVYCVGIAYFTRLWTIYTARDGSFLATMPKPPLNTSIQIEVPGNGAYNRPLPTYRRP